ncbi:hypothetical protein Tco_0589177 [Tanacetum coccineum]
MLGFVHSFASQLNIPHIANEDLQQSFRDWKSWFEMQMAMLIIGYKVQEIKTTRTRKAQEGLCLWKDPLSQLWCHVMVLVGMTRVTRQRKDLIMHSWLTHLQVLTQSQDENIAIIELRKKLEIAKKEKDRIQFNVDKIENAYKSLNKLIESQIVDNCKKGLGYNAVPPPYTENFMPPTPDLSFIGLDEFVNKPVFKNKKSNEEVSKVVRKSNDSPIIEDWVSDSEEENVSQTKTEKKTVKPSIAKIEC